MMMMMMMTIIIIIIIIIIVVFNMYCIIPPSQTRSSSLSLSLSLHRLQILKSLDFLGNIATFAVAFRICVRLLETMSLISNDNGINHEVQ